MGLSQPNATLIYRNDVDLTDGWEAVHHWTVLLSLDHLIASRG